MPCQPARIAAILALSLSCASAAAQDDKGRFPCAERLQARLQELVDLPESAWRYVILEEPEKGSFIQFGWWGGVVVDLPIVALDAEQEARATQMFDQLGAATPLLDRGPDGAATAPQRVFQHDFGRDAAAAARFGCAALRSIYLIADDLPLEIMLGGD